MKWNDLLGCGGSLLALGLACLGGCHTFNESAGRATVSLGADPMPAVAPAQAVDMQLTMARSLEKRGEVEQATALYREALKSDPGRADASWRLAVLADEQGKWNESAGYYRKALAANPGNADLYCDMGYSLYLQHRWPEAEMNLRQALALNREHRRAHNNLGLLLARTDRVQEALVEFRTAKCDVASAHVNVAYALMLDRHWQEAREHYERAAALDPSLDAARSGLRELNVLVARTRNGQTKGSTSGDLIQVAGVRNSSSVAAQIPVSLPPRMSEP